MISRGRGRPILFIDGREEGSRIALQALNESGLDFDYEDIRQYNGADFTPPLLLVNGDFYRTKDEIVAYAALVKRNGGQDPLGRY